MEEFLGKWAHWISAYCGTWHLTDSGVRFIGIKLRHTHCRAHLLKWGPSCAKARNPTPEMDWEEETCWFGCYWHKCANPQTRESCPAWVQQCVLPAPGSQFLENWDCGKSFPQELPRNARPGGLNLYQIYQQGRGHRGGSQGWSISGQR